MNELIFEEYDGFIQIDGDWFNINSILSIKRWSFDRHRSIITFINGDQKTVSESVPSLMLRITEAKGVTDD